MANINHSSLTHDDWHDQDTLTDQDASPTKVEVKRGDSVTNQVDIKCNNADALIITQTAVTPGIDSTSECGSASKAWSDVHTDALTLGTATQITDIVEDLTTTSHTTLATSAAVAAVGALVIPKDTQMVFAQASVPTGWTDVGADTYSGFRVRADGSGDADPSDVTGGTHGAHEVPSTAHTHTMGTHVHKWYEDNGSTSQSHNSGGTPTNISIGSRTGRCLQGVNGGPNMVGADYYTNAIDPGDTNSATPTAFAPKYTDVVIGSKDAY